jgi:hypothetical protein
VECLDKIEERGRGGGFGPHRDLARRTENERKKNEKPTNRGNMQFIHKLLIKI